MRLIFLILSTVFGALCFFVTLLVIFKFSTANLIAWLILLALSILFLQKYRKYVKKEAVAAQVEAAVENKNNAHYAEEHREELRQYTEQINQILISRYFFRHGLRPGRFLKYPSYKGPTLCDPIFHRERKSPQEVAKIIYNEIVFQGNDYDPKIFQERYSQKKFGKLSKFNKIVFGAYAPTGKQRIGIVGIGFGLFLIIYGIPQAFLGPHHGVFVPSKSWNAIAHPLIWTVTLLVSLFMIINKQYRDSLVQRQGKITLPVFYLLTPLLIWLIMQIILGLGLPKFLNEIFGHESKVVHIVTKDMDTSKSVGRHGSTTAYCVVLETHDAFFMEKEYCINQEHYELLPQNIPVVMKFHGTGSYFGFRIDGYFSGFSPVASLNAFDLEVLGIKN